MRSKRTRAAFAVAILLGLGAPLIIGTPAFADTPPDATPPALEAPTDARPPSMSVPIEPAPVESAPPVVVPSPEPTPDSPAAKADELAPAPIGATFDVAPPTLVPSTSASATTAKVETNRGSFTSSVEVLDASDNVISTVTGAGGIFGTSDGTPWPAPVYSPTTGAQMLPADINGAIKTRTVVNVHFPSMGNDQYRFDTPTVNSRNFDFDWPVGVNLVCDTPDAIFKAGDSVTVTCITTASTPDVQFDEWRRAVLDQFGNGVLVPLSTEFGLESRFFDVQNPELSGSWTPPNGTVIQAGSTLFQVKPAPQWLPTAQDKSFRVKATETLTVTPDGLLTGAQWAQGNVGELQTHITNVPDGGKVTLAGNLEFTTEQVGAYDFTYFLQDPASGLRSRDAAGNIEVYSESSAIPVPPATPLVNAATPSADAPAAPAAKLSIAKLASTGADSTEAIYLGALALLFGGVSLFIGHLRSNRRGRVACKRFDGRLALAALTTFAVAGIITGCSAPSTPPFGDTPTGLRTTTPSTDDRWTEAYTPELEDNLTRTSVRIDPDGSAEGHSGALEDASKKSAPATIPANGNILVTFFLQVQSVPREMVKAYISADSRGSAAGPPIVCASESHGSSIAEFVNCTASFRDRDYKAGTYYGVFETVPRVGFEKYGARTFKVPFYTTRPASAPTSDR